MLRQYALRILRPHWLLGLFGVLFALFSARDVASVFSSQVKLLKLDHPSLLDFAGFTGLIVLSLSNSRSILTDLLSMSGERRIVCGSAQAGTEYDYRALLSKDPKRVVLAAQNMHTVIQDPDFLHCISSWLRRNEHSGATLTIILSTPKALGALSGKARDHQGRPLPSSTSSWRGGPIRENQN